MQCKSVTETLKVQLLLRTEVSVVCNNTKSSSNTASDYCNNSSSYFINYVSEAERVDRSRSRDGSHDRSSGYRRSRSPSKRCNSDKLYYNKE